jgi:hypothetical protein
MFSHQTMLGYIGKKADECALMRVKLEEREIETKVKDDALVKQRREEIMRAASKIFTEKGYQVAMIRDILLKGKR